MFSRAHKQSAYATEILPGPTFSAACLAAGLRKIAFPLRLFSLFNLDVIPISLVKEQVNTCESFGR
jgi:hypothetical protein